MSSKVLYIGNFNKSIEHVSSQVKKTKSIVKYLNEEEIHVKTIDTSLLNSWNGFFELVKLIVYLFSSDVIILSINKNGLKFLRNFLLKIITRRSKKSKLIFITIGGWLAEFIEEEKLERYFKCFDMIYVQSNAIKEKLEHLGIYNSQNMKNFRNFDLKCVEQRKEHIKDKKQSNSLNLIYFSRVSKDKGIEIAIESIQKLISDGLNITLDIYGPISPQYKSVFNDIIENVSGSIRYKGLFTGEEDVYKLLSMYDFLLMPTYYDGEGFPTVFVESFVSGLPVITTNWKYNSEIIIDNYNGYLIEPNNVEELTLLLNYLYKNKSKIIKLKLNCLEESIKYHPSKILDPIIKFINS